ncbi:MAG: glycosyltransferase involved in cell wall biosynthesis [Bradymonadia bacterium]|jgi:glycosyltransferase involved in cell wall biosynthesis
MIGRRSDVVDPVDEVPPLHVGHLMATFQTGGLERVVEQLAITSRGFGVKTTVFAYSEDGELRQAFNERGIDSVFLPTRSGIRWDLGLRLAKEIEQRKIDVLHSHHLGPYLYGAVAATMARVAHVTTEHSREAYDHVRRRLLGRSMSKMARVVTVSRELADWRVENFGCDPEVILNGVTVPRLDPSARAMARKHFAEPDEFIIGCVARFSAEKDHSTLLHAFRKVVDAEPRARLVLIGWGPEEERLGALIRTLGLEDRVTNLGRRDDVEVLVHGFDVVTLSSVREGLPLALLEGMAVGVPAVGTEVGEIERLVEGGCGIVVPPSNPDELAQAYLVYATDSHRRLQDGQNARRRVEERYSAVAMTGAYVRLYREAVLDPAQKPTS